MNVIKFSCLPLAKNAWKSLSRYWMSTHSRYHKGSSLSSEEFKLLMFMNQCFLVVSFHSCKIQLNKSVHEVRKKTFYKLFYIHCPFTVQLSSSIRIPERNTKCLPTRVKTFCQEEGLIDEQVAHYICFSLLNYIHEEFDIDDEVTIYIFIF